MAQHLHTYKYNYKSFEMCFSDFIPFSLIAYVILACPTRFSAYFIDCKKWLNDIKLKG